MIDLQYLLNSLRGLNGTYFSGSNRNTRWPLNNQGPDQYLITAKGANTLRVDGGKEIAKALASGIKQLPSPTELGFGRWRKILLLFVPQAIIPSHIPLPPYMVRSNSQLHIRSFYPLPQGISKHCGKLQNVVNNRIIVDREILHVRYD